MQLNDLMLSVPDNTLTKMVQAIRGNAEKLAGSLYGTFGKIPRFELTEKVKEEAVLNRTISLC